MGDLTSRALPFGSILWPLILGSSHLPSLFKVRAVCRWLVSHTIIIRTRTSREAYGSYPPPNYPHEYGFHKCVIALGLLSP